MHDVDSKDITRSGDFLLGGGIMGDLIRTKDWSETPLGPIMDWPQSLRTTVSLCLASNFPINLIWGPEHIQIYNDGYRPICAGKHPASLGESYTITWASAWEILDESFQRALSGETSYIENQRMFLDRNGYLEETFFTFSLSPIRDESGDIGGLFHPVTETTPQMLSQRRTRALQEAASRTSQAKSGAEACTLIAETLSNYQLDIPFALIYLSDGTGTEAKLAATAHLEPGTAASPLLLDLTKAAGSVWPLEECTVNHVQQILGGVLSSSPYPECPGRALILPVKQAGRDQPAGYMIAGVSTRLPLTDEYRAFYDLLAGSLSAAITNARAYEEERKRAERLAELDKAKTAFFSNVSHEFRTPLTLMLGPLEEMLTYPGQSIAVQREMLALVHRNGLRLLRLVNNLLDFSRIEANRVQASFEPVDLSQLTLNLASVFRSAVEKAGLALHVDTQTIAGPIFVDREMWEKIVFNLLSNAFKFTLHGSITVALLDRGSTVELQVTDTGSGIPAHELPYVFKRFHRVQGTHGRTFEGTGIGLALVEDLAALHGGNIGAESTLGEGSRFRISIPKGFAHLPPDQVKQTASQLSGEIGISAFVEEALRWSPTDLPLIAESTLAAPSNKPRRRILLADDNADMRQYIQTILQNEYDVAAFGDGASALAALKQQPPDMVLTDVMMPVLDGFGLLKALRSDRGTQHIPCVMLSARAGEEARVEGMEAGADDYLVKPFNSRELLARVRVTLELARLRRDLAREEEAGRGLVQMEKQWHLFDTALSHTPDEIYIVDLQKRFLYANRAFLSRSEVPLAQLTGGTLALAAYTREFLKKLEDQLQQVIDTHAFLEGEATLANRRQHRYSLVPVMAEDGSLEAVAISSRDITDLKENNRALREANNDLQQFAFSASHDLQEPLRMVAIYSQLLKKRYSGRLDSKADEIIDQCVDSAIRMEALIRDLLVYTRASVEPVAQSEPVPLDLLVDRSLENLRAAVEETNAVISRQSLPKLKVEAVHLQQLFQNLLGNALKYHQPDRPPVIAIAARQEGAEWIISIKDNGIGIAPDYKDQIFGLFKRLHSGTHYSGTGMGLAICKKMVERYGGRIWVESEVDSGSTFLFTLPAETEIAA